MILQNLTLYFWDKILEDWNQWPKNSLRKTERFGDKRKLKRRILEFQFDFGDLIENNKFFEFETVLKIIENVWDQRKILLFVPWQIFRYLKPTAQKTVCGKLKDLEKEINKKQILEFQFWRWRLDWKQQIYWIWKCFQNHWKCLRPKKNLAFRSLTNF